MSKIPKIFLKEYIRLSEEQVIDLLINWKSKDGTYTLTHLFHGVYSPRNFHDFYKYEGCYITKNILRQNLGFKKGDKPGDFDIIIIPFSNEKIFFERTIAIEIKIVRPTRLNPKKSPTSLGITQLNGLINDGFPFISLIHICMTEPLLDSEKMDITYSTIPVNSGKKFTFEEYEKSIIDVKLDHFSWFSADNQIKRLISRRDLPKFAGISAFGLNYNGETYSLSSCSEELAAFQLGYFNPNKKPDTIKQVEIHFENNRHLYSMKLIK